MTSARRFAIVTLIAGLLLPTASALAQSAPTTNTPATDTIGPAELQNFNLKGTVTRPADQTPAPTPARPQTTPARSPALTPAPSGSPEARTTQRNAPAPAPPAAKLAAVPTPVPTPSTQPPVNSAPAPSASTSQDPPALSAPTPASAPVAPVQARQKLPLWPWIAATLALLLAGGFLLWRRWPREAAADGPQFDLLVPQAPEPEPKPQPLPRAPVPTPAPVAAASAAAPAKPAPVAGIVASRLRPALELAFHPLRCQVDDLQVAIEFELELFNAGAAPARAVLAEASLLNAGATQDNELSAFFANPNGVGDRLAMIPPMKRVSFKSQVVAPRAAVQEYELAGRKAFVPVIAFNALYEWSGGKAQSSAAYLVGRDTQQEKLGPLRLDQGAREYHGLGARPLPSAVRT
jgi:hypothetical protein